MCGRYASYRSSQQVADEFGVMLMSTEAAAVEPNWNIAPTTMVRVIFDRPAQAFENYGTWVNATPQDNPTQTGTVRAMGLARWGLIPPWAKTPAIGARMMNARVETLASKRSFKRPFATSRCIVIADGYYEWHTNSAGIKTPYYIFSSDSSSLAFAGLFSWWADPHDGRADDLRWVLSTTIVTTEARDGLEEIHDREPLMLAHEAINPWLDPHLNDPNDLHQLMMRPGPRVSWHAVSPTVGSVAHNGPHLIAPTTPPIQDSLL